MQSVYYVLTYACHRRCRHCYDARFRPYVRSELDRVVGEGLAAYRKVIANLPDDMSYQDPARPDAAGNPSRLVGRIILAGGEVMLDPVREKLFYPALDAINEKYGRQGARISMQTTGDTLTERQIDELLERNVWMIAIASMDEFHVGLEGDKGLRLREKLLRWFEARGIEEVPGPQTGRDHLREEGPFCFFFGAQPGQWIGELWPRGRAFENGLSTATMETNFCARHSGGKNFLSHGWAGAEVAIEPNGDVYPCCLKTKHPIGNLTEEPLIGILDSLKGHPVFEAINRGAPDEMGAGFGWDAETFRARSHTVTPGGVPFANLCIGCDAFHEEVLGPVIEEARRMRLAARRETA